MYMYMYVCWEEEWYYYYDDDDDDGHGHGHGHGHDYTHVFKSKSTDDTNQDQHIIFWFSALQVEFPYVMNVMNTSHQRTTAVDTIYWSTNITYSLDNETIWCPDLPNYEKVEFNNSIHKNI